MGRLSTKQKNEIQARVTNFDFCGIDYKLTYNLCRHGGYVDMVGAFVVYQSRFILSVYLLIIFLLYDDEGRACWLKISFHITCHGFGRRHLRVWIVSCLGKLTIMSDCKTSI